MITRKTEVEVFKDGIYYNGETDFTFNVKVTPKSTGFEWELEVPKQPLIVTGEKYNEETGEDDPFALEVFIDPFLYDIKLRNKEAILGGYFNIETIHIDPKSKKLEIEFDY